MNKFYFSAADYDILVNRGFEYFEKNDKFVRSNSVKRETVWRNASGPWTYIREGFCSKEFSTLHELIEFLGE